MAAPWEKDAIVEEHPDTPAPANDQAQPWASDQADRGYGQYGSGGAEDDGQFHDPNDNGTEASRTEDGRLLVDIHGDADPYEVAGQVDNSGAAAARGVGDTLTFGGANRIFAGIQGLDDAMNGGSFTDGYDNTLKHLQDVMHADEANHPVARITGQLLGGLAIPPGLGLEGVGATAGASALRAGATMREARAVAATAVRNRMALLGGAGGATHGALESDNLASTDAAENAVVEGLSGAAGGLALGAVGERLAPRMEAARVARRALPLSDAQRVGAAAERLDQHLPGDEQFPLLPADVGSPTIRRITSAGAQAPISATPIINAGKRVLEAGKAVRDRLAASAGTVEGPEAAGIAAREGADTYIKSSSSAGGAFYREAEKLADGAQIDPIGARAMLDEQIARLQAVPGGGQGLADAKALRESLNGKFTVQGIRDMRTEMQVAPELRGGPVETRMKQIVNAAAKDVENGLRTQGKGAAADAFQKADAFWKQRLSTIDDVIEPIIGRAAGKGGEAVTKAIDNAAKGDVMKLQRFIEALPDEQASVVRASFIGRLGRAVKGQQDESGEAFSLPTFLSNWSDLSPRAKAVMFNPEQRASLQDLATVANGVREAQKYAAFSNTPGGLWGNIGALFGLGAISRTAAVSALGTQMVTGRLLASPRFARWLARAPKTQLSAPAYLDRLTRIARAEPAIANDVLSLQSRLSDLIGQAPSRAAADDKKGKQ